MITPPISPIQQLHRLEWQAILHVDCDAKKESSRSARHVF